jgi:hypothetical protein
MSSFWPNVEKLCDPCLVRLEQWLAGGTTPHEFLECLLIVGEESNLERFFCPRCTGEAVRTAAVLLSQLERRMTDQFDNEGRWLEDKCPNTNIRRL